MARMGLISSTAVMVYAPRAATNSALSTRILRASHRFARGEVEGRFNEDVKASGRRPRSLLASLA